MVAVIYASATRIAPGFTLADTACATVRLADLRGKNVALYFSEGTGCQSYLLQVADIESTRPTSQPPTSPSCRS